MILTPPRYAVLLFTKGDERAEGLDNPRFVSLSILNSQLNKRVNQYSKDLCAFFM